MFASPRYIYSIYIWQQLSFSEHIGVLSQFPYNIGLILIVAVISYHFVEKPFLRLKSRFIKTKPQFQPAPVVVSTWLTENKMITKNI
jgi:peptidoglycan/LPS O-acetylase OafA/YrhL